MFKTAAFKVKLISTISSHFANPQLGGGQSVCRIVKEELLLATMAMDALVVFYWGLTSLNTMYLLCKLSCALHPSNLRLNKDETLNFPFSRKIVVLYFNIFSRRPINQLKIYFSNKSWRRIYVNLWSVSSVLVHAASVLHGNWLDHCQI